MHNSANPYPTARQRYEDLGVDVELALDQLAAMALSLPCWQGDDVGGFEGVAGLGDGGIRATGNYPGKARNADELRSDLDAACRLIPGPCRINLHAMYLENLGRKVERDEIGVEHFADWIQWARESRRGLDFNPTFFSHHRAADGFTLTSNDEATRRFWVNHGIASRRVAAAIGRSLQNPCVNNVWIPDGQKDIVIDRKQPRERLERSLNEIFAERFDRSELLDCVESKLFGIGSESYVAGSHEFYLGYAVRHGTMVCLDTGHFHPTESIADKISSVLQFVDRMLLHLSRGVRWDSDHVVVQGDETNAIAQEVVRGGFLDRVSVGLDFFDASIHRVAAWVIGARATLRSFLQALLEPTKQLRHLEQTGNYTARLALLEHLKAMPEGDVWDEYCRRHEVPLGLAWLDEVQTYESQVTSRRRGNTERGSRSLLATAKK